MTNLSSKRFYVYAYLRSDGTPYYIGRGTGRRIHNRNHSVALPSVDRRRILVAGLTNDEANEWEVALISILGRKNDGTGCLRNLTEGGGGVSGFAHTEEHKSYIGQHFRRFWQENPDKKKESLLKAVQTRRANYDDAARERAAAAQRGKKASAQAKANMAAAQRRRFDATDKKRIEEVRAKAAASKKTGTDARLAALGYEIPECPQERERLLIRVKNYRRRERAGLTNGQGTVKGTAVKAARLNEALVIEIRRSDASARALAKRLGVSVQTICNVRNRTTWAHVA